MGRSEGTGPPGARGAAGCAQAEDRRCVREPRSPAPGINADTNRRGDELLHVLTPTDSCRDRLAALLVWNDLSGLEQAIAVCRAQWKQIDLDVIRDWCERERGAEKYELFASRLADLGLR